MLKLKLALLSASLLFAFGCSGQPPSDASPQQIDPSASASATPSAH